MRIGVFYPPGHAQDLLLSGTWTPRASYVPLADDGEIAGVVALDRPSRVGAFVFGPGTVVSICVHGTVLDLDRGRVLFSPTPAGAPVLPGPWLAEWVNGGETVGR